MGLRKKEVSWITPRVLVCLAKWKVKPIDKTGNIRRSPGFRANIMRSDLAI